jgi:uncharacterized membrane protein YoaK (UPF0700 family)
MQGRKPLLIAAFLTWIAGFVDAVGFVSLGHIYTANMSGNSVAVGIQSASQNWPETIRRFWPVLLYLVGLLFCRLLIEWGARERIRSIAALSFVCEIVLLLPVFLSPTVDPSPLLAFGFVALLAAAMGVQNAAVTHFSTITLHTGFVTGTLVKFAEHGAKYLSWLFDQITAPSGRGSVLTAVLRGSARQDHFRLTIYLGAVWICYAVGASCGALGDHSFQFKSLLVPMAGLAVLAVVDAYAPFAQKEEEIPKRQ